MPDLNGGGIMSIVETAREFSPTVRGINFQPISYFGTYEPGDRVTIPRVIRALTASGEMKPEEISVQSGASTRCAPFRERLCWKRAEG
jgi:uncharacterized radical SAM superfamily Fe-S cluster-containing enzyme